MNKRKPTITGLQKEIKSLEEKNSNLITKSYNLDRDKDRLDEQLTREKNTNSKLTQELINAQRELEYNKGFLEGQRSLLANYKTITIESREPIVEQYCGGRY